jgi:hydrogenase/urease accessory protein HupE
MRATLAAVVIAWLLLATIVSAHDARPAHLEITAVDAGHYDMLWRTPLANGVRLPVALRFPDDVEHVGVSTQRRFPDSVVERQRIVVDSLVGLRIDFVGLQATITDVLVRTQQYDGATSTTLVRPAQPWMVVSAGQTRLGIAWTYVRHGVEHILLGYDHLLFVLALLLVVPNRRSLLKTITAFTAAHSITLALAVLGIVHVPGPPVEAVIALSIVLLACEAVRLQHGDVGMTARWPWAVALVFGLLHGFGFAGGLSALGLPATDVPLALCAFNVGVELGQLTFVGAVLTAAALLQRFSDVPPPGVVRMRELAPQLIGIVAAFWFCERLAQFVR